MATDVQRNNNKVIIVVLVVVLVALLAVVGYMYTQRSKPSTDNTTSQQQTQNQAQTQNGSTDSNPMGSQEDTTPFDTATATKVPQDQTPEQYLEAYLTACDKADWTTAFNMLPLGKKTTYGDAKKFGDQLAGYGINGHSVTKVSENKDAEGNPQVVLTGTMKTASNGNWSYDWTFVQVDGQWYAKTRGAVQMQ